MNNTKSNFGKWGWAMIIYCAISYYMAAVLSTDTLNWYPSAFASLRGWGEGFVNLCNAMAGLGGWIGVAAAIIFSIMAAKKGSRFMAVFGNVICGILCIIFATTKNMGVFLVIVVCLTFVSGNIQLNVVPNNIMNIWFPHKKGLALGWASMYSNHYPDSECNRKSTDCLHYHRHRMFCCRSAFHLLGKRYSGRSWCYTG